MGQSGPDRSVVKVIAPDGLGLLEATSRWLAERGVSIEAAEVTTARRHRHQPVPRRRRVRRGHAGATT